MKRLLLEKDSYRDSVFLMLVNRELKGSAGVREAVVSMATAMNLELIRDMGLWGPELDDAGPNDLLIAVDAVSSEAASQALEAADKLLKKKTSPADSGRTRPLPVSLDAALRVVPEASLAVISLPGAYAAHEARKALNRGLHVMLFSDNVSLKDEISLKKTAGEKNLLLMGPDCGTAIINGIPLCFANKVRRGDIGVVAASGTGLQEVTSCIDRFGGGISQAIGTGGRDLKNAEVGGMTMLAGIEALKNDAATKVIVVLSKPPAPEVAVRVVEALECAGKPSVVHFIGMKNSKEGTAGKVGFCKETGAIPGFLPKILYATNLEETSGMAVALSKSEFYQPRAFSAPDEAVQRIVEFETGGMANRQRYLRGLYTGGTLADEAVFLLEESGCKVFSNIQDNPALLLPDPSVSVEHTVVDLGEDFFTLGRPHPMIEPSLRRERILSEGKDPETAVILLDFVLGRGSHEDPAGAAVSAIQTVKGSAAERNGHISVIASITGTQGDPQNFDAQKRKLEEAGCVVMPSNYQACLLAAEIIRKAASK